MVRHCVANNCTSRDIDHVPGVQLHKFPADLIMKEKWMKAIQRDGWVPCGNSRLCSRHFEKECYTLSPFQQMVLKKTAVPTIFNLSADDEEATKKDFLKPYVPRSKSDEPKKRSRSKSTTKLNTSLTSEDDDDEESQNNKKSSKKKQTNSESEDAGSSDELSYFPIPDSHFICG